MRSDHLIALRTEKRWLYWQHVTDKNGRPTKVPKRLNGANASSTDPNSWETFDRLIPIPPQMAGVGIALGGGLIGVDMDACLNDGQLEPWANEVLEQLSTYAEVSPSEAGIKLLLKVDGTFTQSASVKWGDPVVMPDGSTKHRELAVFSSGRYFTVTEKIWRDAPIRFVTAHDIEWVMERIEAIKSAKYSSANPEPLSFQPGSTLVTSGALKQLPTELRLLIEQGAPEGTRSEQFHRAVGWLRDKGLAYEASLNVLRANPQGIAAKYAGRLDQEFERCWQKVSDATAQTTAAVVGGSALERLKDFVVTDEWIQDMTETRMIWRNLIASSHIAVWAAPGNGGKTTIARLAAAELAASGHQVWYFQEDASAGDLPSLQAHSKEHGYLLLNSTLANGSPEVQLALLQSVIDEQTDLSNTVMFFDTLKKYNDLMSKGGSRDFFKLMRGLTIRGCTIIALGHTNKHKSVSGELMFEGVADVRNDVDELYYIESVKNASSGLSTLTFKLDKVRCLATPATFELDVSTMQLRSLPQVVDVKLLRLRAEQMLEDAELIDVVRNCLHYGSMKKTELIVAATSQSSVGKKRIRCVVERYCSSDPADPNAPWIETYVRQNNTRLVSINTLFKDSQHSAEGV